MRYFTNLILLAAMVMSLYRCVNRPKTLPPVATAPSIEYSRSTPTSYVLPSATPISSGLEILDFYNNGPYIGSAQIKLNGRHGMIYAFSDVEPEGSCDDPKYSTKGIGEWVEISGGLSIRFVRSNNGVLEFYLRHGKEEHKLFTLGEPAIEGKRANYVLVGLTNSKIEGYEGLDVPIACFED
ncbi:MAG: hypothetical protein AB1567_05260 [bacterium]